jgi:hypothetical protein
MLGVPSCFLASYYAFVSRDKVPAAAARSGHATRRGTGVRGQPAAPGRRPSSVPRRATTGGASAGRAHGPRHPTGTGNAEGHGLGSIPCRLQPTKTASLVDQKDTGNNLSPGTRKQGRERLAQPWMLQDVACRAGHKKAMDRHECTDGSHICLCVARNSWADT